LEADILQTLLDRGDPVCLADGIYLRRSSFEEMRDGALELIDLEGTVTVGSLRDRFQTSRKFALAVLEHLDGMRLTRRVGDARVRGRVAPSVDSTRN
jgi:selenocysteine-specific elongation factor